jgi:DNA-binding response OmpR family regulator
MTVRSARLTANYDVIVLDIMVLGKDSLAILKALRREGRNIPVILLTARNELDDRLEGLNLDADDYLSKPFFVEELIARIHAVVRRVSGDRQNILTAFIEEIAPTLVKLKDWV